MKLEFSEWASAGSRTWAARVCILGADKKKRGVLGSRLFQGKSRKMFQCVVWGMRRTQNLALRLFFVFFLLLCFFGSFGSFSFWLFSRLVSVGNVSV